MLDKVSEISNKRQKLLDKIHELSIKRTKIQKEIMKLTSELNELMEKCSHPTTSAIPDSFYEYITMCEICGKLIPK